VNLEPHVFHGEFGLANRGIQGFVVNMEEARPVVMARVGGGVAAVHEQREELTELRLLT
jgi:hypothetical protein